MEWDVIIRRGRLADPEKGSLQEGTLGIRQGKIAAVLYGEACETPMSAPTEIDAGGLVVCPGFIDVHGHIDGNFCGAMRSMMQGITTTVGGNCGLSPIEMDDFFLKQDDRGFLIHQAELVGHSFSLRRAVGLTDPYLPADEDQIKRMVYLAERALDQGACGLSFGLDYAPGSGEQEIMALSRVAARYGRIIPIHTRMFTSSDLYSLTEAVSIARLTGGHVQVSHLVYQYPDVELMGEALSLIECARRKGLRISVDSGLYTAFAAPLGTPTFDEETIDICGWNLEEFLITTGPYRGRRMTWALYKKLRVEDPDTSVVCFSGQPEAIYMALKCGYVMPSTDSSAYGPGEGHPQGAASFPKYFADMVRRRRDIPLIEAVRRATLLPAGTMGLAHKGRLSVGADADLVLFDPDTIEGKADFAGLGAPDAPPEGLPCVLVSGVPVLMEGRLTGALPGKVIRY